MRTQTVTVLGINGRIGQEVAKAFAAAGWRVIGLGRENRVKVPGVAFFKGETSPAEIEAATREADVVVNALNLPYDKWDKGRAEAQLADVLKGLEGSGKTLMFPGNIYNYGATQHVITPDTPQHPEKDKGEIRMRMEQQLATAANRGDVQVIIVRSPDFYAPGATGSLFDLAMMARLKSNVIQYPGPLELVHSWAYLPDMGKAYVKIAQVRDTLPGFESFLYRGHVATGHEMVSAIQAVLPQRAKVRRIPWWALRVIGLFMPVVREVVKMKYLWFAPHQMRDDKLEALLGADFHTPFEDAVAKTTLSYLPEAQKKIGAGKPA